MLGSAVIPVEAWPWNVLEGGCMFMMRRAARVSGELTVPMAPPEGFPR